MARTFKGYASKYQARQLQVIRVRRQQVRSLVVDFAGALEPGQLIDSATWECTSPWITLLGAAEIADDQKSTQVEATFNYSGRGWVKCTVTLNDNSQMNYEFECVVTDCPMYPTATYSSANGPYSVTAETEAEEG